MKKKLKIGIDIDNVIADTGTMFLERFNKEFGTSITYEEVLHFSHFATHSGVDSVKVRHFTDVILNADDFFDSLVPYQEALDIITQWSVLDYSIHYITARSTGSTYITREWLQRHGFLIPGATLDLYDERIHETEAGYKNVIAKRLGLHVMIEDDLDYAKEIEVRVLLLDRPWNRGVLPKHVTRIKDWEDIEEIVKNNFQTHDTPVLFEN